MAIIWPLGKEVAMSAEDPSEAQSHLWADHDLGERVAFDLER